MTIYHRTYFEWQQAGERIDRMVDLPRLAKIDATMYAIFDGHVYRIMEAQASRDADNLDIYVLSLRREEARYDIFRP